MKKKVNRCTYGYITDLNETFGTKRMAITRHLIPYDFYFNWITWGSHKKVLNRRSCEVDGCISEGNIN